MLATALTTKIAMEIKALIRIGVLAPEMHLNTQRLADRFGVSRSPVRQALSILEEQGIVEQQSNRGFFVAAGGLAEQPLSPDAERDLAVPADADQPYYRLAEDWLQDRIPAGVTELLLRERYQITKSEFSDMMARASTEGWAERKAGYGWRLLPVVKTAEALEQVYRFRSIIEPAALLEPTFEPRRGVLSELRRAQESMLAGDIMRLPADRLLLVNMEFHEELTALSGNPYLAQALNRVNRLRRLLEYRSMVDRSRLFQECTEHLAILQLVERGENIEASSLMRRHLHSAIARKAPIHRQLTKRNEA